MNDPLVPLGVFLFLLFCWQEIRLRVTMRRLAEMQRVQSAWLEAARKTEQKTVPRLITRR